MLSLALCGSDAEEAEGGGLVRRKGQGREVGRYKKW